LFIFGIEDVLPVAQVPSIVHTAHGTGVLIL